MRHYAPAEMQNPKSPFPPRISPSPPVLCKAVYRAATHILLHTALHKRKKTAPASQRAGGGSSVPRISILPLWRVAWFLSENFPKFGAVPYSLFHHMLHAHATWSMLMVHRPWISKKKECHISHAHADCVPCLPAERIASFGPRRQFWNDSARGIAARRSGVARRVCPNRRTRRGEQHRGRRHAF